jgi:hypothetical protein
MFPQLLQCCCCQQRIQATASHCHSHHAEGVVLMPLNSAWNFIVKGWPATTRVELVLRPAGTSIKQLQHTHWLAYQQVPALGNCLPVQSNCGIRQSCCCSWKSSWSAAAAAA